MIKIPYAISSFVAMVDGGFHYVDRTQYIARLEAWNERYIFFLRPRRFGKTLFISMLQYYYGREFAKDFQRLFGHYGIGQQPTPLANQFAVLRMEFSGINTNTTKRTFDGFLANVRSGVGAFLVTYADCFNEEDR